MFEVAVLGAGPAGLATAICCAEAGLDVCVLDRSAFPRPSVGEAVHPGAEALFERLGVADRIRNAKFVRHTGIWVQRQREREFVPFGETAGKAWRGYQLWRPSFDQILFDRAKELGCRFIGPSRLSDAIPSPRGVTIHSSAGNFASRVIVDATGRNRWLTRHWGLKTQKFSPTLVARYEYAEGQRSDLDDNPVFVPTRDGWVWIARVHKNLYQRIALRYVNKVETSDPASDELQGLQRIGRSRGADVTWTLVDRSASVHHFLVGDAAAVLDPSSSHGILRALSSGILAASCIPTILGSSSIRRDSAIAGYRSWQRSWFLHDLRRMRNFTQSMVHSWRNFSDPSIHASM